jgi:hypothetical protein
MTKKLYRGGEVQTGEEYKDKEEDKDKDKKFIVLHQFNTKDSSSLVYFMQYTNNVETIKSFADVISKADYGKLEEGDEYVKFEIDSKNLVSNNTAVEMEKCNFGMFKILTGIMKDPFTRGEVEDMEGHEAEDTEGHKIATLLDKRFYSNKIPELFDKQ